MSRFLHHIVALYSDPTSPVRDAAASTLVEIYRHVGDRVRIDLQKKHNIPPAKLSVLMSKFDAMRASGDMMPTAMSGFTAYTRGGTPRQKYLQKDEDCFDIDLNNIHSKEFD